MIKGIFCDMDGTLLMSDHTISEENKAAILAAQDTGVKFHLATGRIYPAAKMYAKQLGITNPLVCCNGAIVVDPVNDATLAEFPLSNESLRELIRICREADVYFHFYNKNTIFAEKYERIIKYFSELSMSLPEDERIYTEVVPDSMEVLERGFPLYKLGIYYSGTPEDDALVERLCAVPGVQGFKSLATMVDFMAVGVDKGKGIAEVTRMNGWEPEEVMAIGDNENDIGMIRYAGIGVAMDNAVDSLKDAADAVVACNMTHGVADAIGRFVLKP